MTCITHQTIPVPGPMYLSSTHGAIAISGMQTSHLRNAICKKFREGINLPRPYKEVIDLLVRCCNRNLPPQDLSQLISSCYMELSGEDPEMFNLLGELFYREEDRKLPVRG
jgi:hypothetical protein